MKYVTKGADIIERKIILKAEEVFWKGRKFRFYSFLFLNTSINKTDFVRLHYKVNTPA